MVGVLPAHQRFDSQDPPGVGVDFGLVVQQQLALLQGAAQLAEQGQPFRAVLVLFGIEEDESGVGLLGGVHGDVGPLQQLLGVVAVFGVQRHPDAGLDVHGQPVEWERLLEGVLELPGHRNRALGRGDAGQQHCELVAAEPSDGVDLPQRGLEPLPDLEQELVAVVVAEGVVDLLEPVQVDEQQRRRAQLPVGLADGLAGAVVQQRPVGQAGESVREGLVLDAALVTKQQQPAAGQQPESDGEDDRHGEHEGPAELALGGDACLDLFLLVLGALVQLLSQLDVERLHLANLDGLHSRGVIDGDRREQSSGRLLILLEFLSDLPGEGDVVGVGMLDDVLQGLAQCLHLARDVGSGLDPLMLHIPMPCELRVGQRHPGVLPHVLFGAVTIDLTRGDVGPYGRPQAEPGQQHQDGREPDGGYPATMSARPPL